MDTKQSAWVETVARRMGKKPTVRRPVSKVCPLRLAMGTSLFPLRYRFHSGTLLCEVFFRATQPLVLLWEETATLSVLHCSVRIFIAWPHPTFHTDDIIFLRECDENFSIPFYEETSMQLILCTGKEPTTCWEKQLASENGKVQQNHSAFFHFLNYECISWEMTWEINFVCVCVCVCMCARTGAQRYFLGSINKWRPILASFNWMA